MKNSPINYYESTHFAFRHFCCSTVRATLFSVNFEVNVMIIFWDYGIVAERIPITTYRR